MKIYFVFFLALSLKLVKCICPNNCGFGEIPPRGVCDSKSNYCLCGVNFYGLDCSELSCKEFYNSKDCEGNGVCNHNNGVCTCYSGYTGAYCSKLSCPISADNKVCNGNGVCVGSEDYNQHFTTDPPNVDTTNNPYTITFPTNIITHPKISFPSNSYGCLCNNGYSGYDCSVKECPKGAVTEDTSKVRYKITNIPSDKAFDIYLFVLVDTGIYRYEKVNIKGRYTKDDVTRVIIESGVTNYVNVKFLTAAATTVSESTNGITLYFPGDDTIVSPPPVSTDPLVTVTVLEPASDTSVNLPTVYPIYKECSGLGKSKKITGTDAFSDKNICQIKTATDSSNVFPNNPASSDAEDYTTTCKKHGDVKPATLASDNSDHKYCECKSGFDGSLCEKKTCGKLASWFGYPKVSECNNRGICDNNGNCQCDIKNGYIEKNGGCTTRKCPNDCNNHGKCVYKDYGNYNGLYEGKCECDELWEGVECNKRKCPYGPDPELDSLKASGSSNEQSYTLVTIKFDTTTNKIFRLVYRNRIASDNIIIKASGTATHPTYGELVDKITSKNVLRGKIIPKNEGDTTAAPTADSNDFYTYELKLYYYCLSRYNKDTGKDEGPEVTPDNLILEYYDGTDKKWKLQSGGITVAYNPELKTATSYDCYKCSNAGKCNENTGECECFSGYTSSNRYYNNGYTKGFRADCSAAVSSSNPEEDEL